MPSEIDIYRSAKLLIDQHSEDAPVFAPTLYVNYFNLASVNINRESGIAERNGIG